MLVCISRTPISCEVFEDFIENMFKAHYWAKWTSRGTSLLVVLAGFDRPPQFKIGSVALLHHLCTVFMCLWSARTVLNCDREQNSQLRVGHYMETFHMSHQPGETFFHQALPTNCTSPGFAPVTSLFTDGLFFNEGSHPALFHIDWKGHKFICAQQLCASVRRA